MPRHYCAADMGRNPLTTAPLPRPLFPSTADRHSLSSKLKHFACEKRRVLCPCCIFSSFPSAALIPFLAKLMFLHLGPSSSPLPLPVSPSSQPQVDMNPVATPTSSSQGSQNASQRPCICALCPIKLPSAVMMSPLTRRADSIVCRL